MTTLRDCTLKRLRLKDKKVTCAKLVAHTLVRKLVAARVAACGVLLSACGSSARSCDFVLVTGAGLIGFFVGTRKLLAEYGFLVPTNRGFFGLG